jgi:hypothetical protein
MSKQTSQDCFGLKSVQFIVRDGMQNQVLAFKLKKLKYIIWEHN